MILEASCKSDVLHNGIGRCRGSISTHKPCLLHGAHPNCFGLDTDSWVQTAGPQKTRTQRWQFWHWFQKEKRWREPNIYQCSDNNLWFENGLHKRCGSPMMNRDDMTPFERHFSLRKDRAQGVAFCQPHIGTRLQFWLLYLTVTSSRIWQFGRVV